MEISLEDQLYDAVSRNDLHSVRKNLRKDVNINTICSNGLTALGAAAHLGHVTICETLIENYKRNIQTEESNLIKPKKPRTANIGYFIVRKDLEDDDLDGQTPDGMDALEWDTEIKTTDEPDENESYSSLYKWYADILNRTSEILLLPSQCDINQIDRYGRNALQYASERGHFAIARDLITAGANVNACGHDNVTSLHLASANGHVDIVRALISSGASVNAPSTTTLSTPLHYAATNGHCETLRALVQFGAKLEVLDDQDRSALTRAILSSHGPASEFLLLSGARVNTEDSHGNTPLSLAVHLASEPLVSLLLRFGAKVTQSQYLLHRSIAIANTSLSQRLLQAGCVVNLRDDNGDTPLILACRSCDFTTANLLLANGALADLPSSVSGASPLMEAVEHVSDSSYREFNKLLHALATHGMDIANESFPLVRAALLKKTKIATCLVKFGVDVNLVDGKLGVDAMFLARRNDDLDLARVLVFGGYDLKRLPRDGTSWIVDFARYPLPLVCLCRIEVRRALGPKVWSCIGQLGLPRSMVRFLELADFD